jgi:hypothetical protein
MIIKGWVKTGLWGAEIEKWLISRMYFLHHQRPAHWEHMLIINIPFVTDHEAKSSSTFIMLPLCFHASHDTNSPS